MTLNPLRLMSQETAPTRATTQPEPEGFFTVAQRRNHWWFTDPAGKPFFSIGLNHFDPASLRYPENIDIWREKYGGSTIRWIRESVAPNLKAWGFNTVGWVQEVSVREWRHSRSFTVDEYRALEMPYCHLLPFMESHQWEKHTVHYDFRSADWQEWCDYVARSQCAELADDPNLIGYFYSDCPTWIHERPLNEWRGPIFDPERLESEVGRRELTELAYHYYKTTHDAIRRYDRHHLILGDRYEANAPIALQVIQAASLFVDVLSFQDSVIRSSTSTNGTGRRESRSCWPTRPGSGGRRLRASSLRTMGRGTRRRSRNCSRIRDVWASISAGPTSGTRRAATGCSMRWRIPTLSRWR